MRNFMQPYKINKMHKSLGLFWKFLQHSRMVNVTIFSFKFSITQSSGDPLCVFVSGSQSKFEKLQAMFKNNLPYNEKKKELHK